MNTWSKVVFDDRVWLGSLSQSRTFSDFVNNDVDDIVETYEQDAVTFELLVQIQYEIAAALSKKGVGEKIKRIATTLAGHKNKSMFLATRDTTEQAYCMQILGLNGREYARMKTNRLTVGNLYRHNPTAFLAPLLPKNKYQVN